MELLRLLSVNGCTGRDSRGAIVIQVAPRCFFDWADRSLLAFVQLEASIDGHVAVEAIALRARWRKRVRFVVRLVLRREPPDIGKGCLRAQRGYGDSRAAADQVIHPEAGAHHERKDTHVQAHRHPTAHGH